MAIRMYLAFGLFAACVIGHAPGEDRMSIRISSTGSPIAPPHQTVTLLRGTVDESPPLGDEIERLAADDAARRSFVRSRNRCG